MIVTSDGKLFMDGLVIEVLADTVTVLRGVYQKLAEEFGEEYANEKLVMMGRLAIMGDDDIIKEIWK